jgi:hypothetical protein
MDYPTGQIETPIGPFQWTMFADQLSIGSHSTPDDHPNLTINQVTYRGTAHLRLVDNKWTAHYGDIFLYRYPTSLDDPTRAAKAAFKQQVEEIAATIDNDKVRKQAKTASLHADIKDSQDQIEQLKEDIADQTQNIQTCKKQLKELGV